MGGASDIRGSECAIAKEAAAQSRCPKTPENEPVTLLEDSAELMGAPIYISQAAGGAQDD